MFLSLYSVYFRTTLLIEIYVIFLLSEYNYMFRNVIANIIINSLVISIDVVWINPCEDKSLLATEF